MKAKLISDVLVEQNANIKEAMHWDLYRENLKRKYPHWKLDIEDKDENDEPENIDPADQDFDQIEFNKVS
jgi:hypothetical protein